MAVHSPKVEFALLPRKSICCVPIVHNNNSSRSRSEEGESTPLPSTCRSPRAPLHLHENYQSTSNRCRIPLLRIVTTRFRIRPFRGIACILPSRQRWRSRHRRGLEQPLHRSLRPRDRSNSAVDGRGARRSDITTSVLSPGLSGLAGRRHAVSQR